LADADAIVSERLILLRNETAYLKQEAAHVSSFERYQNNVRLKKAVERSLQVSVEICLDVGRRIVALDGFRYPDDNQDVFRVLAEEQVIPRDLLETLLDMARFRNLIVHDYARIDDARVYGILKKRLADLDAFAEAVRAYLLQEPDAQ